MSDLNSTLVKSSQVVGVNVTNVQDESLGKIEEIVLDKFTGQTKYVVLSFGGVLGLGEKLFALPWKLLHYQKEKDKFSVNLSKEKLKEAPGFSKDNWPNFISTEWQASIEGYYSNI